MNRCDPKENVGMLSFSIFYGLSCVAFGALVFTAIIVFAMGLVYALALPLQRLQELEKPIMWFAIAAGYSVVMCIVFGVPAFIFGKITNIMEKVE